MMHSLEIYESLFKIGLSVALGMFIGIEREWAHKEAGIRTFTLVTLCGTIFSFISHQLVVVGAVFIVILSVLISIWNLSNNKDINLTTMVSLMLAYGVGILIEMEFYTFAIAITIIVTAILSVKHELHGFAKGLTDQEIKGVVKFGILAFVIFPVLPNAYIDPWHMINPRTIWLMVMLISAFGFINYIIMKRMGSRGIIYTGFFGGLANSTAVVFELASRVRGNPNLMFFATSAVLLSNVAMCMRNLFICAMFSWQLATTTLFPLLTMMLTGLIYVHWAGTNTHRVEVELKSPFSITHVLLFGFIFVCIIVISALAHAQFGDAGFYVSKLISGMISSASATTSAIVLYQAGKIDHMTAALGIIISNISSVVTKIGLVRASGNREFAKHVIIGSSIIIISSLAVTAILLLA